MFELYLSIFAHLFKMKILWPFLFPLANITVNYRFVTNVLVTVWQSNFLQADYVTGVITLLGKAILNNTPAPWRCLCGCWTLSAGSAAGWLSTCWRGETQQVNDRTFMLKKANERLKADSTVGIEFAFGSLLRLDQRTKEVSTAVKQAIVKIGINQSDS